jgi:isopropylmalate/homocitrate/citramalate synthase
MQFKEPYESLATSPRDLIKHLNFPDPSRIKIHDCSLRDGEQMPGVAFSPRTKYELLKAMSDIGVHIVEIGFPVVSQAEMETILDLMVLCRTSPADVDATLKFLRQADIDPAEITFCLFTSASDLHLKYKMGRVLMREAGRSESEYFETPVEFFRQSNIRLFTETIRYTRGIGTGPVQMMAEDVSRANVDYVAELYGAGAKAGGFRPALTDTVGCLIPEYIAHVASRLVQALGADSQLYTHFHNDYGLATINSITAIAQGVEVFSGSFNAIGERAGNASIQEFVSALRWLYGIEIPGFRYEQLREISRLISRRAGIPIAPNAPIIGSSMFMHESGVHAAGMLIDERIYQSVPGEAIGARTGYVYGKHSGTLVIRFALENNKELLASKGVEITNDLLRRIMEEVKTMREHLAETDHAERIVDEANAAMARLGLTEDDIVRIALSTKGA